MEEQWLNKLKKRSENYERKEPDGLWTGIVEAMGTRDIASSKRRRVVPLWQRLSAVAAVALLLIVAGFMVFNRDMSLDNVGSEPQTLSETVTPDSIILQQPSSVSAVAVEEPLYARVSAGEDDLSQGEVVTQPEVIEDTTSVTDVETEVVEHKTVEDEREKRSVMDDYANRNNFSNDNRNDRGYVTGLKTAHRETGKWSASVYAANMSGNSNNVAGYGNFNRTNPFLYMPAKDSWPTNAMANIMFNNLGLTPNTKVEHRLPLRFGATAEYDFTSRFGIESGLSYTLLRSDLTSGSATDYYASVQTVHYLGIPLNVHFTVWSNSRFKAYVSGGVMMEIPLSGKLDTDYYIGGTYVDSEHESIDVKRLQWSVQGSVGAQYNFIDNLGIYIEPGVGYYFDNGNDVMTIYKDKPFNFNLQIGLRFELN